MKSHEVLSQIEQGKSDFRGVDIEDTLDLSGRVFKDLDLSNAIFRCDVKMMDCHFNSLKMSNAQIHGVVNLKNSCFDYKAAMQNIVAFGNFSLEKVQFKGEVSLDHAEFYGGLWLEQTRFHKASFKEVMVHGKTHLRGVQVGNGLLNDITSYGIIISS